MPAPEARRRRVDATDRRRRLGRRPSPSPSRQPDPTWFRDLDRWPIDATATDADRDARVARRRGSARRIRRTGRDGRTVMPVAGPARRSSDVVAAATRQGEGSPPPALKAAIAAILAGDDDELGVDWQLGRRPRPLGSTTLEIGDVTAGHRRRTGRLRDRSGERASRDRPPRATAVGLLGRLQQRAPAAGADERLGRLPLTSMTSGWRFGLHAAVGSNAVHPRRLRVEAAHRYLAADRAGAGHAWSSGWSRWRVAGPEGPERSGRIAHGLRRPVSARRPPPLHARRTSPACRPHRSPADRS